MKLAQPVLDLSARAQQDIKIDVAKDGTVVVAVPEDHFMQAMPEHLHAPAKELHEFTSNYMTGVTHAVGTLGVPVFKKNKNVDNIEATFRLMGKDTFKVSMDRKREFPGGPNSKDGEKIVQYGVLNTKLDTVSARPNVGQMKLVRKEIGEAALKAFGS